MNCSKYKELIPLLILNELSENEETETKSHLESCEECKKEMSEYQTLIEDLEVMSNTHQSDNDITAVKTAVYRSVLQSAVQPVQNYKITRYLLQAAAAIIIFISGYFASLYYTEAFLSESRLASLQSVSQLTTSFKSYKHSKIGLKLIAKGKQGIEKVQ